MSTPSGFRKKELLDVCNCRGIRDRTIARRASESMWAGAGAKGSNHEDIVQIIVGKLVRTGATVDDIGASERSPLRRKKLSIYIATRAACQVVISRGRVNPLIKGRDRPLRRLGFDPRLIKDFVNKSICLKPWIEALHKKISGKKIYTTVVTGPARRSQICLKCSTKSFVNGSTLN